MMEDSCGPRKRKKISADAAIEIPACQQVQQVHLPHLVVEKIFDYLDFKDLLHCSSVNKFWNHEARRLLREKHQCALTVDLDKKSAKDIMEFKATLAVAQLPRPYGSLSIKMRAQKMVLRSWSKEVDRAQNAIMEIISRTGPFRVVQLDIKCESGTSFEACIIWSVLAAVQKTVKVLKIKNLNGSDLFANLEGLPELTKLEVDTEATISEPDVLHIKNLVKNAVKLESVGRMSAAWLDLLEKLPPNRKLALVKEFTCANMGPYQVQAEVFASLEPKLEKLFIPRKQPDNFYYWFYELDVPTSKSLLLSSQSSLIELQATYEMLQEILFEQPLASFMNLRCLTVDLLSGMELEELDRNDTIIALFPNLEKLKINRNRRSRNVLWQRWH